MTERLRSHIATPSKQAGFRAVLLFCLSAPYLLRQPISSFTAQRP